MLQVQPLKKKKRARAPVCVCVCVCVFVCVHMTGSLCYTAEIETTL